MRVRQQKSESRDTHSSALELAIGVGSGAAVSAFWAPRSGRAVDVSFLFTKTAARVCRRRVLAVDPARRSAANAKAHLPATARKDSCTAAAKQLGFERKKIEPKRETVIVNGEERFVKVDGEIVAAK